MIPKIIHYCWFGGNKLNNLAEECIKSWKKFCPDYEFILWNEGNFDINSNIYVKEAYEKKKWAFVTDYVRLYALYNYGGIYMDTDVELLKSIDGFLNNKAFSGFENALEIPTAIMGSEKGGEWVGYLLSYYGDKHFILPDGSLDLTTNVKIITNMTRDKYGIELNNTFQCVENVFSIYPNDYFCPKDYSTGQIIMTKNTVSIHHFNASWFSKVDKIIYDKKNHFIKKYGDSWERYYDKWFKMYEPIYIFKKYGIIRFIKNIIVKLLRLSIKLIKTDNKVLFFETEGDYSDNGRALSDYLVNNEYNKKYKIIWKVKKEKNFERYKYKNVKFISDESRLGRMKLRYYTAKAKYFFFTHPYWLKNWKSDQCVINMCHSIFLLKGVPLLNSNDKRFDFALVSSDNAVDLYCKMLNAQKEQFLILGSPRQDLLYKKVNIDYFIRKFTETKYDKIILNMPTFRQTEAWSDSEFKNEYSINTIGTIEELKKLNDYLKNEKIILVNKIHHLQSTEFQKNVNLTNIIYITDKELFENDIQLYEFISCTDALLTDYSSVCFDYLSLDRPIGFFVNDLKLYNRGFIVDNPLEFMTGDKIYENEDLYTFLDGLCENKDDYKDERYRLLNYVNNFNDNQNCKRIINYFKL